MIKKYVEPANPLLCSIIFCCRKNLTLLHNLCSFHECRRSSFVEISPPYRAGSVHQELGCASNIAAVDTRSRREQIVASDSLCFAVGEKRIGESSLLDQVVARFLGRISADGDREDSHTLKSTKSPLDPP